MQFNSFRCFLITIFVWILPTFVLISCAKTIDANPDLAARDSGPLIKKASTVSPEQAGMSYIGPKTLCSDLIVESIIENLERRLGSEKVRLWRIEPMPCVGSPDDQLESSGKIGYRSVKWVANLKPKKGFLRVVKEEDELSIELEAEIVDTAEVQKADIRKAILGKDAGESIHFEEAVAPSYLLVDDLPPVAVRLIEGGQDLRFRTEFTIPYLLSVADKLTQGNQHGPVSIRIALAAPSSVSKFSTEAEAPMLEGIRGYAIVTVEEGQAFDFSKAKYLNVREFLEDSWRKIELLKTKDKAIWERFLYSWMMSVLHQREFDDLEFLSHAPYSMTVAFASELWGREVHEEYVIMSDLAHFISRTSPAHPVASLYRQYTDVESIFKNYFEYRTSTDSYGFDEFRSYFESSERAELKEARLQIAKMLYNLGSFSIQPESAWERAALLIAQLGDDWEKVQLASRLMTLCFENQWRITGDAVVKLLNERSFTLSRYKDLVSTTLWMKQYSKNSAFAYAFDLVVNNAYGSSVLDEVKNLVERLSSNFHVKTPLETYSLILNEGGLSHDQVVLYFDYLAWEIDIGFVDTADLATIDREIARNVKAGRITQVSLEAGKTYFERAIANGAAPEEARYEARDVSLGGFPRVF